MPVVCRVLVKMFPETTFADIAFPVTLLVVTSRLATLRLVINPSVAVNDCSTITPRNPISGFER